MSKAFIFSTHTNSPRGRVSERRDEGFESLAVVGGFSAAGLSLACIASRWLASGDVSGLTPLLVLGPVPAAVALGFALESAGDDNLYRCR
jgi:hypothetical protein